MSRNAAYWKGVAIGLVLCLGAGFALHRWLNAGPMVPPEEALVFDPPLVSRLQPWIGPGQTQAFTVQLHNRGGEAAVIEELRFSCPCATGRLDESGRFPVRIEAGDSLPVHVTVTSQRGERGRVDIRYGVIGRVGETDVNPGAIAEFLFAQALNAEPPLVTFGAIDADGPVQTADVMLWSPVELRPIDEITVLCVDPAVTATLEPIATGASSTSVDPHGNERGILGTLSIAVNPRIAPERLKTDVVVHAGEAELHLPVLGLLERTSAAEGADD